MSRNDRPAYNTYLRSRPDTAEVDANRLMIQLSQETDCRMHVLQLSTAAPDENLDAAKHECLSITVETCPHYLFFNSEEIADGATQFKCAPPIRSSLNQARLWEALRAGTIDLVASDHSPCPIPLKKMEEGNFQTAWGGISSLSLGLAATWTAARERGFRITDVVRWMAEGGAVLAGFGRRKGRIETGYDADLVVFNPDAEFTVTEECLRFRHPCSPYLGEELQGQVVATVLRGQTVYRDGAFPASHIGVEVIT